uniref:Uncharacterized protein n=1 Tax=Amphimedon queenslandica TaxID=400682 RepID=A0A1X7U8K2_AMPQE
MLTQGVISEILPRENPQGFYSSLFLVQIKDECNRSVIILNDLNAYVPPCHFKMEGLHTERHFKGRGLADKSASEKCILHDPNSPVTQTVPTFFQRKPRLQVQLPAIWPVFCSLGLSQDSDASANSVQKARSEACGIHK